MINDVRFLLKKEQPLDFWIIDTMSVVNDIIYDIYRRLNQIADEVFKDVC